MPALVTTYLGCAHGSGGYYGYRMSKAALNSASKSLAIDLKPRRALAVVSGF